MIVLTACWHDVAVLSLSCREIYSCDVFSTTLPQSVCLKQLHGFRRERLHGMLAGKPALRLSVLLLRMLLLASSCCWSRGQARNKKEKREERRRRKPVIGNLYV